LLDLQKKRRKRKQKRTKKTKKTKETPLHLGQHLRILLDEQLQDKSSSFDCS